MYFHIRYIQIIHVWTFLIDCSFASFLDPARTRAYPLAEHNDLKKQGCIGKCHSISFAYNRFCASLYRVNFFIRGKECIKVNHAFRVKGNHRGHNLQSQHTLSM